MGSQAHACNQDEARETRTGSLEAYGAVIVGVVATHPRAPALALEYDMTLVGDTVITSFEEDAFDGGAARHGFRAHWKVFATRDLVLVFDLHAIMPSGLLPPANGHCAQASSKRVSAAEAVS